MSVPDLCQACALCCSGSLFRYAPLTEAEVADLAALGANTFRRRDGTPGLRLGCTKLEGTLCGIYSARPFACRDYLCQLAQRLQFGALGLEQALERVREAQAMLARMECELPPRAEDEPRSVTQRAHLYGLDSGPRLLRETEEFLAEHFLGPLPRKGRG
ncbi:MAG: YkgJ family cysteine cluster protein [Myxococcales bacterium]